MPLTKLDHVTVLCSDLEQSRRFYTEVLGLAEGDRPPFNFPGAWIYLAGRPVVHLIGGRNAGTKGTGSFDHVAFDAADVESVRAHLTGQGIAFRERDVPGRPLHQIFLHDPDGVMIELNFRT